MRQFFLFILFLLLSGCGTTQLISYNPNVDIYVNNKFKGRGNATITRVGPPEKSNIEAKYDGHVVGSIVIHRKITFVTCLVGLYTYGIGFFLTWKYPELVIIPVEDFQNVKSFDKNKSIWELPPGEWKK
jgi:hypothetical protein